jgi:hypothetical protein
MKFSLSTLVIILPFLAARASALAVPGSDLLVRAGGKKGGQGGKGQGAASSTASAANATATAAAGANSTAAGAAAAGGGGGGDPQTSLSK